MKNLILLPIVLFLASSCPLQQGADPVVVNAERTTKLAFDTIDTFLSIEKTNQVALQQASPEIHKYAEYLRRHAPAWFLTARAMTKAYKDSRTADNKASLETAIAVLVEAQLQAQKYTAKIANTPHTQ